HASEFSRFRIPEHRWYSLTTDLFGSAQPGHARDSTRSEETGYLAGALGTTATWMLDADDRRYALQLSGSGQANSFHDGRAGTAVYEVEVRAGRLRGSGQLAQARSRDARERIAALYYVQPGYSAAHERASRFFWREVESALRDAGALRSGGLDAYNSFRADEP